MKYGVIVLVVREGKKSEQKRYREAKRMEGRTKERREVM